MQNLEDVYQLRALFQGMTEALIVFDENGKIIRFNEAALRIFGTTPSELLNLESFNSKFRPIKEDLTQVDVQVNPLLLAIKTGVPQLNFVIGVFRKNEELRWLSLNAVPIFYDQQKLPSQILVTFKDITEEKIARERVLHLQFDLTQREKFLSTILNALPVLVSYVDKNLNYQYVNLTYEKWFGVGKHDLIGKHVEVILGEETFKILKPKIEGVKNGEIQSFTSKLPYQGAGERTVEVHYIPDITSEGFSGFFAIINDITELVTITEKIEKHERELDQILNAIPYLVGHWDKNLINIHANNAYSEYFGKDPSSIKGKHIKELLGPELYSSNLPYINKVLTGEVQIFEREIPLNDGGSKHTLAQYLPEIIDEKVVGFFVIVTDITPIKQLLKKEQDSRRKAELATTLRDEMVAVVSHDLRNPLSVIFTSSDILLRKMEEVDPLRRNVERIKKVSKVMLSILTDLLDVNKIEQGHFDVSEGTYLQDVPNFMMEIIDQERPIAKDKNLELFLEIESGISLLYLNVEHMQRVFQNLISNAFKFTPAGGSIWVRAKKAEGGVLFQVEDNGDGIKKELLPILFERFSQGQKKISEGSGLGLAIAKGIVEAHEGKIWVESVLGQGSTFNIYIPFARNNLKNESVLNSIVHSH